MTRNLDYREMGHRIRNLRKKQGITQEQLAEGIGVSASFVGHIERGEKSAHWIPPVVWQFTLKRR